MLGLADIESGFRISMGMLEGSCRPSGSFPMLKYRNTKYKGEKHFQNLIPDPIPYPKFTIN